MDSLAPKLSQMKMSEWMENPRGETGQTLTAIVCRGDQFKHFNLEEDASNELFNGIPEHIKQLRVCLFPFSFSAPCSLPFPSLDVMETG